MGIENSVFASFYEGDNGDMSEPNDATNRILGRFYSRPLAYSQIHGIERYVGTFENESELPTSGVPNNGYALIEGTNESGNTIYTCYKYDGSWNPIEAEDHITPIAKELIIDYSTGALYVCNENRNIEMISASMAQIATYLNEFADNAGSLGFVKRYTHEATLEAASWEEDSDNNAFVYTIESDLSILFEVGKKITLEPYYSTNGVSAAEEKDCFNAIYKAEVVENENEEEDPVLKIYATEAPTTDLDIDIVVNY